VKANKTRDSTSVVDVSSGRKGSATRPFTSPKETHAPGPTVAQASEGSFAGKGEMSALMRSYDWSSHPLGPASSWPQSLRTAVSICLESRFPILVWWGSELFMLYNDAYRRILGAKHPRALGQAGADCLPEIWGAISPVLEGVLKKGEATWSEDQRLLLDRDGYVEECYFTFSYSPIRDESGEVGGVFTAVTETTEAEKKLRALNSKLLQTQDDERRRIARDLHDSAGQILVALKMNLFPLQQELANKNPELGKVATSSIELVDDLSKELRTMSHLLHPPLLDEAGLPSALRWYVEGFAERSGVEVKLDLDPKLPRLSQESETALFRIVQECLTNIHRHSGGAIASVRIDHSAGKTRVEIRDNGKGISQFDTKKKVPKKAGVGIQGMQERVRQLKGEFEIRSGDNGTTVVVVLPGREVSA